MKRWLIAAAALLAGGGVSAALLVVGDPARGGVDVYAAAHDIAAGAALSTESLQLRRVSMAGGATFLFTRGDESHLVAMHAAHDLAAGQLIQRGDVMESTSLVDRRLVFIPLSGMPPAPAGARVDLLFIGGSADHPTVEPFALGVEVQASVSGGLIVTVPAKEAAAFVYAAAGMHLAAVVAEPGTAAGTEVPISSIEDAISVVSGRSQ
jgi:hypothetical protein